jgi:hypothetical protein
MLYTGVDYHRSFSFLTVMNEKGEIIAQEKLPSNGRRLLISSKGLRKRWR